MTPWHVTVFPIARGGCYSSRGFSGLQRLRGPFFLPLLLTDERITLGNTGLLLPPVDSMFLQGHGHHQARKGQRHLPSSFQSCLKMWSRFLNHQGQTEAQTVTGSRETRGQGAAGRSRVARGEGRSHSTDTWVAKK